MLGSKAVKHFTSYSAAHQLYMALTVEREIQGQSVTSHPDPLLDAS